MALESPEFVLCAQHGWADDRRAMVALASSLAAPGTIVVAPSLGFVKTWLRIEPLVQAVENLAIATRNRYPDLPLRIVGHSMGGLIWLEVLNRHPEWWTKVESLVLLASPIGGADLGRMIDPLGIGLGIARDLGRNRRPLAEAIAASISTLVIAGDVDGGSDGTIPVESTKVHGAKWLCLPGISHAALRTHPQAIAAIQDFWKQPQPSSLSIPPLPRRVIQRLQAVPGMTDAHQRDFRRSKIYLTLQDGTTIRVWKNAAGVIHAFVACDQGTCLYGGFVGWVHTVGLHQALEALKQEHTLLRLP